MQKKTAKVYLINPGGKGKPMNNFTNKLYILTEHDDTYTQLIVNRDLPDPEITTNPEQRRSLGLPLAAERLDEFKHLIGAKHGAGSTN